MEHFSSSEIQISTVGLYCHWFRMKRIKPNAVKYPRAYCSVFTENRNLFRRRIFHRGDDKTMQTKVLAFLLCFPGSLEEMKRANFIGMGTGGEGYSSNNVDFAMMQERFLVR